MGPEGSLPHSQEPPTSPYPEPGQSSPCPTNTTSWRSILILSTHVRLGRPSGLLTSGLHHENPVYTSPRTCYMPCPSPSFDQPNNIWCRVQIMKLLVMQSSPLPCYLVPLRPKYPLSTLFSKTLNLHSSLNVRDQVSQPYKTINKIIVLCIYIFIFLDSKMEG